MRQLVRKYGAGILAVALTVTVIVISMGITFVTQWGTGRNEEHWFGLLLAAVIPLITAGPTMYAVFGLLARLDVAEQKNAELVDELQEALDKIQTLRGLLPICASCKKIRDEGGHWHVVEAYIKEHSQADFTHGLCPECADGYLQELDAKK